MEGFIRDVVRDNMSYMESVFRDVMVDKVASGWDKMEELEEEDSLEFTWPGKGTLTVICSFNPIFHRSVIKVCWWKKATDFSFIVMRYDGEWDMHVSCQGGESMVERVCEELVEEANQ